MILNMLRVYCDVLMAVFNQMYNKVSWKKLALGFLGKRKVY